MKICILQDPRGNSIGGSDFCVAVLARRLIELGHSVQIAHYQGAGYLASLESAFEMQINCVDEVLLPMNSRFHVPSVPIVRRASAMRHWMKNLSLGADGFVCMTHSAPPFNYARRGITFVHFPFRIDSNDKPISWKQTLSHLFYTRLWRERMKSYSTIASNSQFTKRWTQQYWNVDSEVIYPPVEILKESRVQKEKRIVILGRFSPAKKQHELIQLFLRSKERLPNWKLVCIGSKDPDCHYFKQIEQMVDSRVCLLPNASRSVVFDELNRASVFWHAMGLNVDENANPLMIEHFGISTVEAMAAGCIPITVNKGGQREIVTHNVNGFLCDTLDDFVDYSCEVDQKPELSNRLGHAAKSDVLRFDRPNFENAVLARLGL